MAYTQEQQVKGMLKFRKKPERFFVDALGIPEEYIWDKMLEVMHSVRDNQKTAVKAGHSVSKSFSAARLALQFLYCYGPKATVITTAPTDNQVVNVLWREIREAKNGAKTKDGTKIDLPGEVLTQKLEIDDKWFAIGFATKPDTITKQATAFQGFHNEWVLVIFDEAAGILPQIWDAAESLIATDKCRWLVIGNPTSSFGNFANCFREDSDWHKITISCLDTPNYKEGREVVPGLAGRGFVERYRKKYGDKSNTYQARILGQIPEFTDGAIFGKELKQAKADSRILDNIPHDTSCPVHTCWDLGISGAGNAMAIWFFQLVGQKINWIDYIEGWNEGLIYYIDILHAKRDKYGWIYGRHIAPHDINVRQLTDGATRMETAKKLGIPFIVCGKPSEKGPVRLGLAEGIEAARQIMQRSWFDRTRCDQGLKALSEYHWKLLDAVSRDDRPVYSKNPVHDASSNGSDAFRYGAIGLKNNQVTMGNNKNNHADWEDYYERQVG